MSHSLDETYDVWDRREVTARKPHSCCACGGEISVGHRYFRVFVVFDGDARTYKRCRRCEAIHRHLIHKGGNETYPDEALNCGETYEDHWGVSPPAHIAALAFITQDEGQLISV